MHVHGHNNIIIIMILSSSLLTQNHTNYSRSEQIGSLMFVTFFIHCPVVFVMDAESVKVSYYFKFNRARSAIYM